MSSRTSRVVTITGLLMILVGGALTAMPTSAEARALAQEGCAAGYCGVIPAAWDSPYTSSTFTDAVNFTNYANVANYVGYTNVVNAVNYTNLANYVAYRNTVNHLVWAAGQ
jgi:hypothetical protein